MGAGKLGGGLPGEGDEKKGEKYRGGKEGARRRRRRHRKREGGGGSRRAGK